MIRKTLFILLIILDRFSIACFKVFDTVVVHMLEFKYEVEGIFGVLLINIICVSAEQLYIFTMEKGAKVHFAVFFEENLLYGNYR